MSTTLSHVDPLRGVLDRDIFWERCRNSLGIARLLVQEGRPESLVATACWAAVEAACLTGLEQAGVDFDGDIGEALSRLGAPEELWSLVISEVGPARVAATERVVGWMAAYLRAEAPDRSWGY